MAATRRVQQGLIEIVVMAHLRETLTAGPAFSAANFLSFAASPTFVIMALVTHLSSASPLVCSVLDSFPLDGMVLMYLLMSVFHSTPWVKLVLGR